MKKKIQQILLTSLLFVFSILIISIPTQAAKPAATTVKSKENSSLEIRYKEIYCYRASKDKMYCPQG